MRLFIGIKTGCESYLAALQQELKKAGSGNFTQTGNLHITLKFLGEVLPSKLGRVREAISEVKRGGLYLEFYGIKQFNKKGIVSAEVGGELDKLAGLFSSLEAALEKRGFQKDLRYFNPHITLARDFRSYGRNEIESIHHGSCRFQVKEIILFESRRESGDLVYTPLFNHKLLS